MWTVPSVMSSLMTVLVITLSTACFITPVEQVEQDVLTFLERKYDQPFAISRYVQRVSHEGNGFADYHDVEAYAVGAEDAPFHIHVLYEEGGIAFHNDGYHRYSDRGMATRDELNSILEAYGAYNSMDAYAFGIYEMGLTEFESREALETYRFVEDEYGLQYFFDIGVFSMLDGPPAPVGPILRDVIDRFDDAVTCMRIDVEVRPAAYYRAGVPYSEMRGRVSQLASIQLDEEGLAEFDGTLKSVQEYVDHWDVFCPTYFPGPDG